jgi:uncharacterized protein YkwD
MRKNHRAKRILVSLMAMMLLVVTVACGSKDAGVDETAAVRGPGEGEGETYIDDQAIILAGEAETPEQASEAVANAYNLVNAQRANAGLPALARNGGLEDAARVRAQEISTRFSHTRPNDSEWWTVNSGIQYGENLAKLYQSADAAVNAWMNSPTHRANILDGSFKTVGMAIYQAPGGGWYWAQEFGY